MQHNWMRWQKHKIMDTINGVFEISRKAQQERVDKETRLMEYENVLKNVLSSQRQ